MLCLSTGSTSTGNSQPRTMDLDGLIDPCSPVDSFEYSPEEEPEEEAYINPLKRKLRHCLERFMQAAQN
jgi:hypothetical protein